MCRRRCRGATGRLRSAAAPSLAVIGPGARSPENCNQGTGRLAVFPFAAVSRSPAYHGRSGRVRRSSRSPAVVRWRFHRPDPKFFGHGNLTRSRIWNCSGKTTRISRARSAICAGTTTSSVSITWVPYGRTARFARARVPESAHLLWGLVQVRANLLLGQGLSQWGQRLLGAAEAANGAGFAVGSTLMIM